VRGWLAQTSLIRARTLIDSVDRILRSSAIKAMVYYGANDIRVQKRPVPDITDANDAIERMTKTTICGSDLGIGKGKSLEMEHAAKERNRTFNVRILGREGIGIIESFGGSVKNVKKEDKFIISCVSRCGTCESCQKQLYFIAAMAGVNARALCRQLAVPAAPGLELRRDGPLSDAVPTALADDPALFGTVMPLPWITLYCSRLTPQCFLQLNPDLPGRIGRIG
jgi:hypothetical protein